MKLAFLLLAFGLESNSVQSYKNDSIFNVNMFFPCLKKTCVGLYGCFDPLIWFPTYLVTIPPIAACPEAELRDRVRFYALSRGMPNTLRPVSSIQRDSKVAVYIHGMNNHISYLPGVLAATALLQTHDYVVIVDWEFLSAAFSKYHLYGPGLSIVFPNAFMVGRMVCVLMHEIVSLRHINPEQITMVGFSAGANALTGVGTWCRDRYSLIFGRFVGKMWARKTWLVNVFLSKAIDPPWYPFAGTNYELINFSHAKYVDIIVTTGAPRTPVLDFFYLLIGAYGVPEAEGHCVYLVNPEHIYNTQPRCGTLFACSHGIALIAFVAAESGRCIYGFSGCPSVFNTSSPFSGKTRLNCRDHPWLRKTCVYTNDDLFNKC